MNNDVLIIDGKIIYKSLIRRWTPIAKECYARGCNCQDCDIVPKESFHSEKCNVKTYVRAYFLSGMYPKKENEDVANNND